jgi:NAD dependent epimerase/dehydratase
MKNIFVTGAEGFIGSHLVELLVKKKYNVKALVFYNFSNSNGWLDHIHIKIRNKIEIVKGDVRDANFIEKITKNVDCIINLAALIGIPYSYIAPSSYFETNSNGLLNILNSSNNNGVKKIIHTSTSEVYGSGIYFPMDEKHPIQPQSPYAASKAAADFIALSYFKSFNTPVTILRPFNVFGPRQSDRAVIPTIISQLKNMLDDSIYIGNINTIREFNYVFDTIKAFELAINNKNIIGKTINIGNGFDKSIKEIIKILQNISQTKKSIKIDTRRIRADKSEVIKLKSNSSLAKKYLGWKAECNNYQRFNQALKETFAWYKEYNFNKELSTSKDYVI